MSPLMRSPLGTELALLGFVRREPLHGYEIHRRMTQTPEIRAVWRVKQSRLYALLAKLEGEGFLHTTLALGENRPLRKVFHLTPAGEEAFGRWLAEPVTLPREMRLDFMLKLYFALDVGPDVALALIHHQQEACARWPAWRSYAGGSDSPYLEAVHRYRQAHIDAIRAWLDSLQGELVDK